MLFLSLKDSLHKDLSNKFDLILIIGRVYSKNLLHDISFKMNFS